MSADDSLGARREMRNEEQTRSVQWWPWLEGALNDAHHELRVLARKRTFAVAVTATLALGIGANTAMFSLLDRLLFRSPARMVDPASVNRVYLFRAFRGKESRAPVPYARYLRLAQSVTAFSEVAGFALQHVSVQIDDALELRPVGVISASSFGFFVAPPVLGRYYTAEEDAPPNPAAVAVLSNATWRIRYASRRDVLGTALMVGGARYTVIGVAPDGFVGPWAYEQPVAFVPLATFTRSNGWPDWTTTYGHAFGLNIMVRRKPHVTTDQATSDLTNAFRHDYLAQIAVDGRTPALSVARPRAVAVSILTERGPARSTVADVATWVGGVTIIVLLIACGNVVNLQLARTFQRRREFALRLALGISRARMLSQLLTETMLLSFVGGVLGLFIAVWGSTVIHAAFLPGVEPVPVLTDPRTLIFVGGAVIAVGVVTGLAPMLQSGRVDLVGDLKSARREGKRQGYSIRGVLLVAQYALSVLLLVGAGVFVRSLKNVRDVKLGYDPNPVLLVRTGNMPGRYELDDSSGTAALRLRLLEAAKEVPGVEHATLQESVPLAGMSSWPIYVRGIDSVNALGSFFVNTISADYFATMSTRVLRGRGVQPSDVDGVRRVMVVGQSMGRVLWPGKDPIGQCVRVGSDTVPCTYVVGIAEDIHSHGFESEDKSFSYYLPSAQWYPQEGGLFVRVSGDPVRSIESLRRRLQREMPANSPVTVTRLAELVDEKTRSWVLGAKVFTVFGIIAIALAAVGLYGVIAYDVTQRTHELGVRLALGAERWNIVLQIVGSALRVASVGVIIGCALAWSGAHWLNPLLFNESARDPAVFALVVGILIGVATIASAVPAFRAASLDPKAALLAE